MGKCVLLVDVDAQGLLTTSLGFHHPDQLEITLATLLGYIIMDKSLPFGAVIIHHAEGIDLLAASDLEITLVNTMSRDTILRGYLNSVRNQYDVILPDCYPSLDTKNGLPAYVRTVKQLQSKRVASLNSMIM